MTNSERILVNTGALYTKIIITSLINLYLTRIVLGALGVNDYGIYNLIAGTIAFLSFINSALLTSSQRYFSVYKAKNDILLLQRYFSSSLLIHIGLCFILIIIFEIAYLFLFDGFFNISESSTSSAKIVYQLTCISMIVTVIGVPYNSAINANEDLVFFSVVETISAIAKLFIVFLFNIPNTSPLIVYALWITIITFGNTFIKYLWCKRYPECKVEKKKIDKNFINEMLAFSGWNSLGAFSMVCRSQGIAFVINIFFGTAINAVYGIANQINGQLAYFSQMLTASFAPQIMKCAGENNFDRMIRLSFFSSKAAFFMSAIFAIPLLIEIEDILKLWLVDVPKYTSEFCSLTIFVFLIMQLYPGLVRGIQAIGKIKGYQITISVLLILPIFAGIILYKMEQPSYSICYALIGAQILSMMTTVLFAKRLYGLNISQFYKFLFKAIIGFFFTLIVFRYIDCTFFGQFPLLLKIGVTSIISFIVFTTYYYFIVFDVIERNNINSILKKILKNGYHSLSKIHGSH